MWQMGYQKPRIDHVKNIQQSCQFNCVSGGGSYDEVGNGIKVGDWIEINENYQSITYVGEYKNGLKFGKWETKNQGLLIPQFLCISGGGSYDESSNGIKIGNWIDIDVKSCFFQQIIYQGEYRNGKKIGLWDTWQQKEGKNNQNKKIGGGSYDEDGNEFKIGKWTDFEYEQRQEKIIILNGIYENGNKIGRWNIFFEGSEIGGGFYDQEGDGIKIGKWIDLDERFYQEKQITHIGKYIQGRKAGQWDIYWNWNENEKIGGGVYDEEGNGFKVGMWIDLDEDFNYWKQKILNGKYIMGKKVGSWQEMYLNNKKNKNLRIRDYEN
ncbi:unnamed protein product [Paramecium octaurelia]|uniref:Uncharacterized protein n=1 Tax=Paramecium octaurelia TaxID=43137 RepID=A0A8S1W9U1_PAROT|nr:unnamed protein product [Paramecium octaurelia]